MYSMNLDWSGDRDIDAMRNFQPAKPSKGYCFIITKMVVQVKGRRVKAFGTKEPPKCLRDWKKDVTMRLAEDVDDPETE
jgi:hypothetical protein